jgi:hypothetical protein
MALGIYAVVFGIWTATPPWAFLRFVVALVLIVYFPGKLLVVVSRLRLGVLEDLILSLILGMTVSTLLYWIMALCQVDELFAFLPLGASGFWLFRTARRWQALLRSHFTLDMSHALLAGLVALSLVPLFTLPVFYRNMALLPDGSMTYLEGLADPFFNLSIANELTHSIPPQAPFLAGRSLSYHYAMHVLAAMLSNEFQLNTSDLIFRFLPTLFLVMTVLAIFCFARTWMGSSYAALLAAFLVVVGGDFSFIPGLLLHIQKYWSYEFFHVSLTSSSYYVNPMQVALPILFCGLFCLASFYEKGGRAWLAVTAFLFAVVGEYKIFTSAHVLAALMMAAAIHWLLFRDRRLLKVVAATAPVSAALWVYGSLSGEFNSGLGLSLGPWPYIPKMLNALGWGGTWLGLQMRLLFNANVITLTNLVLLFVIALPMYIVGSLGVSTVAIPSILKTLMRPRSSEAVGFFLACFAMLGPMITLTWSLSCEGVPRGINPAVWFYMQSKHIIWIFAAESLFLVFRRLRRSRLPRPVAYCLILAAATIPTVPSTIQELSVDMSEQLSLADAGVVNAMKYLDAHCQEGEVVLSNQQWNVLMVSVTKCRVPVADLWASCQVSQSIVDQRSADYAGFWESWGQGILRVDILERYQVAYVVADKRADGVGPEVYASPTDEADAHRHRGSLLRPCFEHGNLIIYEVL